MKQLLFLAVLIVGLQPTYVVTQVAPILSTDQLRIQYVPPKNVAHESVYRLLREREVLEKFKEFFSPLRLPRSLLLKTEGCDGVSNAWYENDIVTICYEYLDEILKFAPQQTTPAGVTRTDAILGPTLDIVFHEIGHAVFHYLSIPVLGREEDAADQFSAYFLLKFAKDDARRLILGVAYGFHHEALRTTLSKSQFAGEHGLPIQRFYNILCVAYGADPKVFADLVAKQYLPKERAEICGMEYEQLTLAMTKLVLPYVDETLAKAVQAKRWLNFNLK